MSTLILTPERRIRQRYRWFEEAERLGHVTLACHRLVASRKTYYKWRKRSLAARGDRQALLDQVVVTVRLELIRFQPSLPRDLMPIYTAAKVTCWLQESRNGYDTCISMRLSFHEAGDNSLTSHVLRSSGQHENGPTAMGDVPYRSRP